MNANPSLDNIRFATLARAGEGLTQWRAMLAGFLTLLAAGIVFALAQWLALAIGGGIGVIADLALDLVAAVVLMAGFSAVGVMLMDKAQNQPIRSIGEAVTFGLTCVPKVLLFAILVALALTAFYLVAALVYLICKIPVLGAVLAFIAHPVLALTAAVAFIALFWVINPLFMPAIWSGLGFKAALSNVLLIARTRLLHVVLLELALYIIISVICMLLLAGFLPASMSLTALASNIIGGPPAAMSGFGGFSVLSGSSSLIGLWAGMGVLYCVMAALVTQVGIMGINLIYLQVREGIAGAGDALDNLIGDVRKRAGQAKDMAVSAAVQPKERAAATEPAQPASAEKAGEQQEAQVQHAIDHDLARLQAEAEARAHAKAQQAKAQAEAQAKAQAEAQAKEQAAVQAKAQAEAQAKAQAEAQAKAQAEAKAKAQAEAQAKEQAAVQAKAQAEAQAKAQAAVQAKAQAEAQAKAQEQARIDAAKKKPVSPFSCPRCHAPIAREDRFCGNCGHRLR